jgi:cysteinyl-tRNA synthetase
VVTFKKIVEALESDLAVPEAMSWLNGMVSRVEHLGIDSESIRRYAKEIDNYLGLDIARRQDVTSEQKKLINSREKARIAKDWQKSDELRLKLEQQGIGLNDTNQGPTWHRI